MCHQDNISPSAFSLLEVWWLPMVCDSSTGRSAFVPPAFTQDRNTLISFPCLFGIPCCLLLQDQGFKGIIPGTCPCCHTWRRGTHTHPLFEFQQKISRYRYRFSLEFQQIQTLIFLSLFFWKKQGKPPQKTRIFLYAEPLKSLGKKGPERKNAQKKQGDSLQRKKAREIQKSKEKEDQGISGSKRMNSVIMSARTVSTFGLVEGGWDCTLQSGMILPSKQPPEFRTHRIRASPES